MKTLFKPILVLLLPITIMSCTKNQVPPASTVSALSFVNATVGVSPLVVKIGNPSITYSTLISSNKIGYGVSNLFSPLSGSNSYVFVQSSDTTHTLLSLNLNLQNRNVYSLYLAGTVSQPDTVFIHEQLPVYAAADSVAGIRFINLSQNGGPVSVDIQGQPNGSEAASLAYKGRTGFKSYTANFTVASYTFEYRDVATGNLLATYMLSGVNKNDPLIPNTVRFHNMTIALIGGGTAPLSTVLISNY